MTNLQQQALRDLNSLTQEHLEQRDYARAQEVAWQQLDIDPLHEPALQQLMTALAKSGQRSAAMAQYEIYRKRLDEASGKEPSAELTELYQRIQNDELQQTVLRHPAAVAPEGTINPIFCYTDIESSTRLWDEHREAMLWALRQHNDLCETEIGRFDGRILHPTGDGFLIVFEQNDPLAFAIALQQQFAQADWGEIGELRIRIGFHGATADQEGQEFFHDDGGWYRGPVLNHAARIADTGHGGQIVASDMVKATCPLPPGAAWEDLGAHHLKSLDEAYHIYGLRHPDLALQQFPALRTPANKKAAQVGSHIRGYELGSLIGQGAFGEVYQAQQPGIGRPVAVKKIRARFANQPDFIRRFEAEAQVVARLEHPHIVPLYDYWREADGAFLVMRYMRGGSLKALLEGGSLGLEATLPLISQVGSALAFAHQQGFVHRDIKPANILLDETGNGYLSDFGIVKDLSMAEQEAPSDSVTGTPAYLSPEQALSEDVTPLSDQYSLGVMLYEMLTGQKPFDDTSASNLLTKQVEQPLPLVSTSHPALPPTLDEVIQRATAKDAGARYEDILAMVRALHVAAQKDGAGFAVPAGFVQLEEELVNPYKGLRAFQEADAVNFFGRSALVEQLLTRFETVPKAGEIPTDRFLAVVGPSGSGKSSVVKAGLLPALRRGAVPGSEKWFMVEMIPGLHPLEELEEALLRIAVDPPGTLLDQLRQDEGGLTRVLDQLLPDDGSELLLLIDQFEELFTLVEEDARRSHFINSLLTALNDPHSRLRLVITVRADFYDRPLLTPGLAELMRQSTEVVPPLNKVELEEVILQPALQVGAIFEDGLVPLIIDEVSEQPGALPLLQYALTELFERRQERLLTQDAYADIGGVLGALGRRAEELYTELDEAGEEAARQLFMRLVTLGEGTEDTRRRVLRSELTALQTSEVFETSEVLDAYGRYRLLTFDRDPTTREPTVEVAHEALLRDWPRLRQWLDESRDDVRLQRRLTAAVAEWLHAGRSDDYLLRGSRLDLFTGWFAGTRLALTRNEQAFLDTSTAARQQRQAEEEARRRRELETAQRLAQEQQQRAEEQEAAAQSLRRRALFLGAALVIAAVLAIAAVFFANQSNANAQTAVTEANQRATAQALAEEQRSVAETEAESRATAQALAEANEAIAMAQQATAEAESQIRATAEAQAIVERQVAQEQASLARSRELAAQATGQLESDPELAILLAMEALTTHDSFEASNALHAAVLGSRLRGRLPVHQTAVTGIATSSDGELMVTTSLDGSAKVWQVDDNELLFETPINILSGGVHLQAGFSPDGARLMTLDPGETFKLAVWDTGTWQRLETIALPTSTVNMAGYAFNADLNQAAVSYADGQASIWDLESREQLADLPGHDGWAEPFYTPDGTLLATYSSYSDVGKVIIWNPATGTSTKQVNFDGAITFITLSPDNRWLAVPSDDEILLWDLDELAGENEPPDTVLHSDGSGIFGLAFTPDSRRLATGGRDQTAQIWDVTSGRELVKLGHDAIIGFLAFTPDGTHLVAGAVPGDLRFWDLTAAGTSELFALPTGDFNYGELSPDGNLLATGQFDGVAKLWNLETGQEEQVFEGHDDTIMVVDYHPHEQQIATASMDGSARVWDMVTGQEMLRMEGHEVTDDFFRGVLGLAYSPDGRTIATSGSDGKVRTWDAATGEALLLLDEWQNWATRVAFSPDGSMLAAGGELSDITIWDPQSGQELISFPAAFPGRDIIWGLEFSPDGRILAVSGVNGVTKLWAIDKENARSQLVATLTGHTNIVRGLDFSSDGHFLATSADDGTRLWDLSNFDDELEPGAPVPVVFIVPGKNPLFNPEGDQLMTLADGSWLGFTLDNNRLLELAQSRVTRSFTAAECDRFNIDPCPASQ